MCAGSSPARNGCLLLLSVSCPSFACRPFDGILGINIMHNRLGTDVFWNASSGRAADAHAIVGGAGRVSRCDSSPIRSRTAECHRHIFTPSVSLGACRASASDRLDGNGSLLLRAMRGPVCEYHDCFRGGYLTDGSMLGQPNTSLPPRYSAH